MFPLFVFAELWSATRKSVPRPAGPSSSSFYAVFVLLGNTAQKGGRRVEPVPAVGGLTQHVIPSVLAPSYDADGKSLDESSKIGVMNQSYSWPR